MDRLASRKRHRLRVTELDSAVLFHPRPHPLAQQDRVRHVVDVTCNELVSGTLYIRHRGRAK